MTTIKKRWPLVAVAAGLAMVTLAGCFGLSPETQSGIAVLGSRLVSVEGRVESGIRDGSLSISESREALDELRAIRDEMRRVQEGSGVPAWAIVLMTLANALTGGGAGGLIARKVANAKVAPG